MVSREQQLDVSKSVLRHQLTPYEKPIRTGLGVEREPG